MHQHIIAAAYQAAATSTAGKGFMGGAGGEIAFVIAVLVVAYCLFSPKKKTAS